MKNTLLAIPLVFLVLACSVSVSNDAGEIASSATNEFDSLLAVETGADAYGMRQYVMAYLKVGPNRDQDSTEAAQVQRAHLDNIKRKLNADFVLSGNLQAVEDVVVVNCQLVDLESNGQIWGDKFYYSNEDLIRLEDSIVASVLHPLQLSLTGTEETNVRITS